MVVHSHRERLFGDVLADDVLLEEVVNLAWLGELVPLQVGRLRELLFDDLVAQVDALVADVDAGARDQLLHLLLALPAERALEQVTAVAYACHRMCLLPDRRTVWFMPLTPGPCLVVPCRALRGAPSSL